MTNRRNATLWLGALLAALLCVAAAVLVQPALAQANDESENETQALLEYEQNTIDIVDRYSNSVVSILVEVAGQRVDPFEEIPEGQIPPLFYGFFGHQQEFEAPPQQGSGSGFVVADEGRIVTNFHVVRQALEDGSTDLLEGASVNVVFPDQDGRELPARVLGGNALFDLALLELENPEDLPDDINPIPIGDSDAIRVGQKTIAIGNPFGFQSTVTTGIVSALGRDLQIAESLIPLIQTDAAINPGNSGGALLNSQGELIGINTAIFPSVSATGQRGFLGIGFAVPSNILEQNLDRLMSGGIDDLDTRPRLGVGILDVRDYPQAVRNQLNLPSTGIAITTVEEGSAADEAGLRGSEFSIQFQNAQIPAPGDIIIAADGQDITSIGQLQQYIYSQSEGDVVELTIVRNGQEMTVDVELRAVTGAEQEEDGEE